MTFRGTIEELPNAVVLDRNGDKVGKVGQVYLDNDTQQPSWVTVNTGFFGTNESFIPLDQAHYADGTITVPHEKSFIKDAPNLEEHGELTREQEGELYRYYGLDGAAGATGGETDRAARGTAGPGPDATDRRDADARAAAGPGPVNGPGPSDRTARTGGDEGGDVTLHEEQAHVGTERVQTGRARLRKHVVTDTERVEVPVQREEVVLEREPADGRSGGTLSEEEVDVTLTEERPVVEKETVATENVRLGKRSVRDEETVQTDVSREEIEVDGADGRRDPRTDDENRGRGL